MSDYVEIPSKALVQFYAVAGSLIKEQFVQSGITRISTSELVDGLYFILVNETTFKVVKN